MEFKNSTSNLTILNNRIKGNPVKNEFKIEDKECYQYSFKEIIDVIITKSIYYFYIIFAIGLIIISMSWMKVKKTSWETNVFGHTTYYQSREETPKFPTFEDKLPVILGGLVFILLSFYMKKKVGKVIKLKVNILDENNKKQLKEIYASESLDEISEIKNLLERTIKEKKFEELK
jgi:uncharacterized membrane protein YgaE (UPF0421/DUF939 family)